MKTIETSLLLTALRKMAAYQPSRLLRMENEQPEELLKEIEERVTNAVGWSQTAMGKGASREKMEEMMDVLLKPEHFPENPPYQISEEKIQEIFKKLMTL